MKPDKQWDKLRELVNNSNGEGITKKELITAMGNSREADKVRNKLQIAGFLEKGKKRGTYTIAQRIEDTLTEEALQEKVKISRKMKRYAEAYMNDRQKSPQYATVMLVNKLMEDLYKSCIQERDLTEEKFGEKVGEIDSRCLEMNRFFKEGSLKDHFFLNHVMKFREEIYTEAKSFIEGSVK